MASSLKPCRASGAKLLIGVEQPSIRPEGAGQHAGGAKGRRNGKGNGNHTSTNRISVESALRTIEYGSTEL
ncbi:hypothetical protein QF038_003689 [Pseudarthrobacter sp. W1I19]|uniref:hypothetical protein n=1 Tax=Pseudarthrobacter sp. W1I19 TaxID=3042288 RepID=UPI0027818F94|nr:hypothetical protein [Pseudarthrobacter sp. W1I19]MDQ0925181.1 hypothetical protein [Pseudarthrobacter sp. W1I19]